MDTALPDADAPIPATPPVTRAQIERVVRQIVDSFQPQKVILFGSYAYGRPTPDSDVDLLVVMEAAGQALHAAARIAAAVDHPFPLDILVYEPGALQESLARHGIFVTQIVSQGDVLYEA